MINLDRAIKPGSIILRVLQREGMTQKNLCERTGLSEKHISQIINGEASVTIETSLLLENALGGSASFWSNLEKNYQETIARLERKTLLKNEVSLLPKFPYLELIKREIVEATTNKIKRVENLWKFYGVNSLTVVQQTEAVAFRKRNGKNIKSEHIAAWLRCGEIEAKQKNPPPFSATKLKESLDILKGYSLLNPSEYSEKIIELLFQCGVVVSYIRHFKGTGTNGAVRWIGDIPVIQLSLLGACADTFWFTLFHEIGHLLLHGKKDKFVEFEKRGSILPEIANQENEADNFANDSLISKNQYNDFLNGNNFTHSAIKEFSNKLGIHHGILAGRLCHDHKVDWKEVSILRPRLKFVKE